METANLWSGVYFPLPRGECEGGWGPDCRLASQAMGAGNELSITRNKIGARPGTNIVGGRSGIYNILANLDYVIVAEGKLLWLRDLKTCMLCDSDCNSTISN